MGLEDPLGLVLREAAQAALELAAANYVIVVRPPKPCPECHVQTISTETAA